MFRTKLFSNIIKQDYEFYLIQSADMPVSENLRSHGKVIHVR